MAEIISSDSLSICKLSPIDIFERVYDINDPYINSRVHTKAKGGVVQLHEGWM